MARGGSRWSCPLASQRMGAQLPAPARRGTQLPKDWSWEWRERPKGAPGSFLSHPRGQRPKRGLQPIKRETRLNRLEPFLAGGRRWDLGPLLQQLIWLAAAGPDPAGYFLPSLAYV